MIFAIETTTRQPRGFAPRVRRLKFAQLFSIHGMLAALLLCFCSAAPVARDAPAEPGAFTSYMAAEFQTTMPHTAIKIVRDLRLVVGAGDAAWTVDLHSVFSTCRRNPNGCDALIASHVSQMAVAITARSGAPQRSDIRVIVRPSSYLAEMRRSLAGRAEPVAAALEGDFWIFGALDQPTTIKMLDTRDPDALGISNDQALEIGKKNMREGFRLELDDALKRHHGGVAVLMNGPYESSLLAFHDLWAPIAGAGNGTLFVSIPSSDAVLFTTDQDADAAAAVGKVARVVMSSAQRPFSADVFRWTASGWALARP